MITHEIEIVKKAARHIRENWPWKGNDYRADKRMDKLSYIRFLDTLTVKRGDIVIHARDREFPNPVPLSDLAAYRFYEVLDIQEMHLEVEYTGAEPRCLYLKNIQGATTGGWWTSPNDYEKVPDDCNEHVTNYVNARNNRTSTSAQ